MVNLPDAWHTSLWAIPRKYPQALPSLCLQLTHFPHKGMALQRFCQPKAVRLNLAAAQP